MPHKNAGAPPIDFIVVALERLAGDLRRRAEEAESRAAAAEQRAEMERQAREAEIKTRQHAEARALVAEQSARDAIQRAEASEIAAADKIEQLRIELLAAIQGIASAVDALGASREPPDEPLYREPPHRLAPHPEPMMTGRPEPRWRNKEAGYAWMEDEPGPSWWRRMFTRRY
jgi:hypothetical protein